MPSATIRFTPEFIKACEEIWRDGFNKGVNGEDDHPDFKSFFSSNDTKIKEEPSYAELEQKPFDPTRCEARIEKHGYAIQCTRSPLNGGCLCGLHQNMVNKLPEGKDIPYGRFNQPRPDITLDKGNPIKWGPKKTRKKNTSKVDVKPKLKVGDMRDYLSSRIPVVDFKDLKKKELTEVYLKVKEEENKTPKSSSSDEENTEDNSVKSSPIPEQPQEQPQEQSEEQSEEQPEEQSQQSEEQPQEQLEEQSGGNPEEQLEEQHEEKPEEQSEEKQEKVEDDGKGTGLKLEPDRPKSVKEYKELFDKLGLDYSTLKGRRAYSQAYDDYLKEQENEKTQPMSSDDEDDDELQEDTNSYDEISFEEVDYLEDEETGKIYNLKHQCVGKWNDDSDDIIWASEDFKLEHENKCQ